MDSVEQTIVQIERLYTHLTGREPPGPNGPYAPIPPEKDPMSFVEQSLDRLAKALPLAAPVAAARQRTTMAPVDLLEDSSSYFVIVDLPGMARSEVQVSVANGLLTITAERASAAREGASLHRCERGTGRALRYIALPPDASVDQSTARLSEGVLEIRLPKGQEAAASNRTLDVT